MQKDYGRFGLNWGYASSPLLHQGSLYVQVLHGMKTDDPSYVMKVDAKTGKTVWTRRSSARMRFRSRLTPTRRRAPGRLRRQRRDRHHRRRRRHRSRPGDRQGVLARQWTQPDQRSELPDCRVADSRRRPDHRADARINPMLALRPGGSGDVTDEPHGLDASTSGPTCRRRSATASCCTSCATTASCTRSTSRPAPSSRVRSACSPAPTARRRSWPTARST